MVWDNTMSNGEGLESYSNPAYDSVSEIGDRESVPEKKAPESNGVHPNGVVSGQGIEQTP